jgi:hypothetical protein
MNALPADDFCHEHADGCLCGLDHAEHEATPDDELPPATGGVEKPRRRPTKTAVKGDA